MNEDTGKVVSALDEIAVAALSAKEIYADLVGDHLTRNSRIAHISSLVALVEKIGFIADLHSSRIHGDASHWMLPHKYHRSDSELLTNKTYIKVNPQAKFRTLARV